jgi:hypothetical protein
VQRVKVDHDPAALSGMAVQPQAMISNQLTRQARRLYIGSIPLGATDVCRCLGCPSLGYGGAAINAVVLF